MSVNRWYQIVIVSTLIVVTALTIQAGLETTALVSAAASGSVCTKPEISSSTIHSTFVPNRGLMVAFNGDAPTGVDGGLLALLSGYRTCSN